MAYLRDNDHGARLARIDRDGIERLPVWRSRLLAKLSGAKISGHLGDLGGHPAAVYLAGGRLWLAVDDDAWHLDEIEATVADDGEGLAGEVRTPGGRYEFSIDRQPADADHQPSGTDLTAFSDVEDWSFGVWAARIVNDHDRQQVLREVLQDTSLATMPEHGSATNSPNMVQVTHWRLGGSGLHSDGEHSPE